MPTIDEIIQGIALGASDEQEAEAAFARRFEELVALPVEVSVGGAAGMLRAVELTPAHGRARALFVDDGGGIWRVSWDAVRMPEGTVGAGIIAAYRNWLGYEVDESDVADLAGTIVSTKQVDERLGDIDRRIAASFERSAKSTWPKPRPGWAMMIRGGAIENIGPRVRNVSCWKLLRWTPPVGRAR